MTDPEGIHPVVLLALFLVQQTMPKDREISEDEAKVIANNAYKVAFWLYNSQTGDKRKPN